MFFPPLLVAPCSSSSRVETAPLTHRAALCTPAATARPSQAWRVPSPLAVHANRPTVAPACSSPEFTSRYGASGRHDEGALRTLPSRDGAVPVNSQEL